MGYCVAYQRGFGRRVISWAAAAYLWLPWSIPSARAAGNGVDDVVVACPELPEARAAELEARARATLLTNDLSATVAISCVPEGVVVRVDAGGDSITLKLRVGAATLREEVLRALDRALSDLRARGASEQPAEDTRPPAPEGGRAAEGNPGSEPPEPPATPPAPAPTAPTQVSTEREPTTREIVVTTQLFGESWSKVAALGGGLGAALRFDSTWWIGIRAGALSPPSVDEATVLEGHAVAEAAFTAHALAGLRLGVGVGPSLLFVSPSTGFFAPATTSASAVRLEAQLSRHFRLGWVELAPWVGARMFTAERGMRSARQTRLALGGVLPQVGLALSFRAELPSR